MKNSWKRIWKNKKLNTLNYNLNSLLKLNGWDTKVSTFSNKDWRSFVKSFIKKYRINIKHKILEVGCGSGAFLMPFYKKKAECVGVDYSKNLLSVAKRIMPNAKFHIKDARYVRQLKENRFDFIFIHSVFQYFDSLNYAKTVLENLKYILQKETKLFILDIPSYLKKKHWEKEQIKLLGKKNFLLKYKNLKHIFFKKNFFYNYCKKNNLKLKFLNSNLLKKKSSKYRMNILIEVKNK